MYRRLRKRDTDGKQQKKKRNWQSQTDGRMAGNEGHRQTEGFGQKKRVGD